MFGRRLQLGSARPRFNIRPNLGRTSVIIRFRFRIHSLQFALRSVLTAQCSTAHWSHCSVTDRVALSALCCSHHSPITISTKSHWVTSFTTYWHLVDVIYNITYIACVQLQTPVQTPRVSVDIIAPKFTYTVLLHIRGGLLYRKYRRYIADVDISVSVS